MLQYTEYSSRFGVITGPILGPFVRGGPTIRDTIHTKSIPTTTKPHAPSPTRGYGIVVTDGALDTHTSSYIWHDADP